MAELLGEADDQRLGNEVDGQRHGRPPADHDGENSRPNGQQGDDHERGGSQGSNNVGPNATAVQDAHAKRQALVE